jgi:AraC-like DNA-binding protein
MIAFVDDSGSKEQPRQSPCAKSLGLLARSLCSGDCLVKNGFCFQRHDFHSGDDMDWRIFARPLCLEICVNFEGGGVLETAHGKLHVLPGNVYFLTQGRQTSGGARFAGEHHRFVALHLARWFLEKIAEDDPGALKPIAAEFLNETGAVNAAASVPIDSETESLLAIHPFPDGQSRIATGPGQTVDLIRHLVLRENGRPPDRNPSEALATRRIQQVRGILRQRMADPPTLEELARMVHCSPFYLSRQFSKSEGMSLRQYFSQIRLDRAAKLLKSGRMNVTEAAMEVGYNSLSHFSVAFHKKFGCCPAIYAVQCRIQ